MVASLPHELLVATVMVALTVVVHLAGLDILLSLTGLHLRLFKTAWLRLDRLVVPLGIVIGLFILHGLEIWLYAFCYLSLHLTPSLESALYASISSYSTLGEAGQLLSQDWRVLTALEAVNGMLLIGWSTAFLFQILNHLLAGPEDTHLPKGAIARRTRRRDEPTASRHR